MITWEGIRQLATRHAAPAKETKAVIQTEKANMVAADAYIRSFLAIQNLYPRSENGEGWCWEVSGVSAPGRRQATYSLSIGRDGTWSLRESVRNGKTTHIFVLCMRGLQEGNYVEGFLNPNDEMSGRLTLNEWRAFCLSLGALMIQYDIPFPAGLPATVVGG